jgi:hypothetical protein
MGRFGALDGPQESGNPDCHKRIPSETANEVTRVWVGTANRS